MARAKTIAVIIVALAVAGTVFATGQSEGQQVSLRILTDMNPGDDMNTDPVTQLTEEITGYNLEFEKLPDDPGQRAQRLNLVLAAGEEVDLIRLSSIGVAQELIPQGYFTPLDDLLEEYGPNILENTSDEWFEPVTWDGSIHAVPIKRTSAASIVGSIYRKDVFESLGIAVPTTPAEFRSALTAVREATDTVPYTATASFPMIDTIASAFGICLNGWYEVDGELVPRVKMDGFVPYLSYVRGLIEDGLMDREIAANTDQITQAKMASERAMASFWAWWWWPANDAIRDNEGAELGYLPPLRSEQGEGMAWLWGTTPEWATVVPKATTKATHAVSFLDALAEDGNFQDIFLGEQGVHYRREGDTYVSLPAFTEEKANSWVMLMVTNDDYRATYQAISQSGEDPNRDVQMTYEGMKNAADPVAVADPTVDLSPPEENGRYANNLAAIENEFILAVLSGVRSVDEYEQFIARWDAEGGAELTEAWNRVYAVSQR